MVWPHVVRYVRDAERICVARRGRTPMYIVKMDKPWISYVGGEISGSYAITKSQNLEHGDRSPRKG